MVKEAIKDKIVIVPKVADNEIKPALITDFESLIPCGKFDILEPFDALIFDVKTINMVIVAGLAFDKKGNRIGYGYGYYDKFLKSVPKSLKIGLCYDSQIVEEIDSDEFDIPVDMIITEKGVIDCRG
jgi:5-formyltetrahydrofolate cyclo-ligase